MFSNKNKSSAELSQQSDTKLLDAYNVPFKRKRYWTFYRIFNYLALLVMVVVSALFFSWGYQKERAYMKNFVQCAYVRELEEPLANSVKPMQAYILNPNPISQELQDAIGSIIRYLQEFNYITAENPQVMNFNLEIYNNAVEIYTSWLVGKQQAYVQAVNDFSEWLPAGKDDFTNQENADLTSLAAALSKTNMQIYASDTEFGDGVWLSTIGTVIVVATLFGLFIIWIIRIGTSHRKAKFPVVTSK